MSRRKAEVLLILIVMAISTSYLLMKLGANDLGRFNVIALRFAIAFCVLAVIFHRHLAHVNKPTLLVGTALGILMFLVLAAQVIGLQTVSTSSAGFLAGTTAVFVPLLQMVVSKRIPERRTISGSLIILTGIVALVGQSLAGQKAGIGLGIATGILLFLLGAVFYSAHIIVADRYAKKVDLLAAGTIEMGVAAVLGTACMLIFETPQLPQGVTQWGIVIALAVVCSVCGLALEPSVQRYTQPERYSVIYCLSPLFACLWGILFMHESLGVWGIVGAVLMIVGTLCSQGAGTWLAPHLSRVLAHLAPRPSASRAVSRRGAMG